MMITSAGGDDFATNAVTFISAATYEVKIRDDVLDVFALEEKVGHMQATTPPQIVESYYPPNRLT